jgi:hypothetical protein
VTSSVNVNLQMCTCGYHVGHGDNCRGLPVLIPCSLEPFRSATFTVALGTCECALSLTPQTAPEWHHTSRCPARPVRVSCSISGKTWAESEVTQCEPHPDDVSRFAVVTDAYGMMYAACRDRWELVKALVLGKTFEPNEWDWPEKLRASIAQRDAVFSALADMARAEEAQIAARAALHKALGISPGRVLEAALRESAIELGSYVEHLVEQAGQL